LLMNAGMQFQAYRSHRNSQTERQDVHQYSQQNQNW
jgi:hypothetical protein